MKKIIQVILLFAFVVPCFGEGSLELLFETPAHKRAREEHRVQVQAIEAVTKDGDGLWYRTPSSQKIDLCNIGAAKSNADIPVIYGELVAASLDSLTPVETEPLNADEKVQKLYNSAVDLFGGTDIRVKKLTFRVYRILNSSTGEWEPAPFDTLVASFTIRRGIELDSASGRLLRRASAIPPLNPRIFTPFGFSDKGYSDSLVQEVHCGESNSVMLIPYEVRYRILENLEERYWFIAEEAAKDNFEYVVSESQAILKEIAPSGNVFDMREVALNDEAIIPLLILSRQYKKLLQVNDDFMQYLDYDYALYDDNRELGEGEISAVSPNLRDALQSWNLSDSEQAILSNESQDVQAYAQVMYARSMGVPQFVLNGIVEENAQGMTDGPREFLIRHNYCLLERGGIANVGFSMGRPMILGDSSSALMNGRWSADFILDLEMNRFVYGMSIGATHYNVKDDYNGDATNLRFNFNLGFRPILTSYLDTYLYGGVILGILETESDSSFSYGLATGVVFDIFFTERHVATTPSVEGVHSFSRLGVRMRFEYSVQKLLDEYRNGLDISLGLVWNFYGYRKKKFPKPTY